MKFLKRLFRSRLSERIKLARKAQEYAKLIAHCRVRRERKLPFFGEDERYDEKLEEIINNFFELKEKKETYGSRYAKISSWLEDDADSVNDRKKYLRVSYWIATETGDEDITKTIFGIKEKIKNLEKKRSKIDERVKKLGKSTKTFAIKKQIDSFERDISKIENQIQGLEEDISKIENQIQGFKEDISKINNQIENLGKLTKTLQIKKQIEERKKKIAELKNKIENLVEPIKKAEVKEAYSVFRKRFVDEAAEFELKNRYNSQREQFSFSLKDLVQYLPLVSAFIIVAGYLHTSFLYGHFGIQTSQFFSLNDYLDSSIDKIADSLYFVGVCLVYSFAVFSGYENRTTSQIHKLLKPGRHYEYQSLIEHMRSEYAKKENRFNWWIVVSYSIFFLSMLVVKIVKSELSPLGHFLLHTVLPCVIFLYAAWYSARWLLNIFRHRKPEYFKNDFTNILLLSVFMFFSSIYLDAQIQIAKIKQKPATVSETVDGACKDMGSLIGLNNHYIFLRSGEGDKHVIKIISRKEIDEMTILSSGQKAQKCGNSLNKVRGIQALGERLVFP